MSRFGDDPRDLVTLGGQNINELSARTEHANRQLTFDTTARQPNRALNLAGEVTLNPDRQEVEVQRARGHDARPVVAIAPGAQPVVRYGDDEVAVTDSAHAQRRSAGGGHWRIWSGQ